MGLRETTQTMRSHLWGLPICVCVFLFWGVKENQDQLVKMFSGLQGSVAT